MSCRLTNMLGSFRHNLKKDLPQNAITHNKAQTKQIVCHISRINELLYWKTWRTDIVKQVMISQNVVIYSGNREKSRLLIFSIVGVTFSENMASVGF